MQESLSNSDENLRTIILAAFAVDERIASAGLRVGVLNGIVHLAGSVDTLVKRAIAEKLVSNMAGVRGVVNRIEAPGAPSPARTIDLNLNDNQPNKERK